MKRYLECAKIVSTKGLKGEVKLYSYCNSLDQLCNISTFYLNEDGTGKLFVEKSIIHKNVVVAKFEGIDFISDAEKIIGNMLYVDRYDIVLEDGDYFIQDVIGCKVYNNSNGECYGVICDVSKTGANDVYHIKNEDGKIVLIPSIPSVVLDINIDESKVFIKPLKGMF